MPPIAAAAAVNNNNSYARAHNEPADALWRSTAKPMFDDKMADWGKFDNIALSDLRGDNSILLMTQFCQRVANDPPISRTRKVPYSNDTLKNVLMKIIQKFKEKFEGQADNLPPLFPEASIAQWKKILVSGKSRTLMEGDKEGELFKSCFPIPKKHSRRTILFPADDFTDPQLQRAARKIDLNYLATQLFRTERFTELAKIVITWKAIARGGEVKFLSYKRMFFDELYNLLFTQWFQRKTLKSTPIGFAAEFEHPESCVYLALGCYWAVDRGLVRNVVGEPGTPQDRRSSFVFQDLHDIQDESVANQLSKQIQSLVPTQLKPFMSVKSFRYGAISMLMWDPAVTYEECIALGGWSSSTNSDWYTWTYLIAVIPAVLTLSGYPDCRVLPYLPSCSKLFMGGVPVDLRMTHDRYQMFVSNLFPNSLREFQAPHGRLRQFLIVVHATMVMHFQHFYQKYGTGNTYTKVMIDSVRTSFDVNQTTAINMLQHWSKVVKDDFTQSNTVGVDGDTDNNNLLRRRNFQDQLLKVNANVAVHLSKLIDMQVQFDHMSLRLNNMHSEVTLLNNWKVRVAEQNDKIIEQQREILELLRANRGNLQAHLPPRNSPQQRQMAPSEVTPPTAPPNTNAGTTATAAAPAAAAAPPPTPVNINDRLLRQQVHTTGTRGKPKPNTSVLDMLSNWYQDPDSECYKSLRTGGPALDDQLAWVSNQMFHLNRRDLPKIKRSLQFVDALWTKEERDKIINKRLSNLDAIRVHETINKRVVKVAHLLKEPMPPSLDPQSNAKSNMQGLGNAISKFRLPCRLEDYVPNWERGGKIKAPTTLMEFALTRANKIRISQKNTYRRNQSSSRTAARTTTRTVPATRVPPVIPPMRLLAPGNSAESADNDRRIL